jgi:hypothetical protein
MSLHIASGLAFALFVEVIVNQPTLGLKVGKVVVRHVPKKSCQRRLLKATEMEGLQRHEFGALKKTQI